MVFTFKKEREKRNWDLFLQTIATRFRRSEMEFPQTFSERYNDF